MLADSHGTALIREVWREFFSKSPPISPSHPVYSFEVELMVDCCHPLSQPMGVSRVQHSRLPHSLDNCGTGGGQNGHFQLLALLKEARILFLFNRLPLRGRDARHRNTREIQGISGNASTLDKSVQVDCRVQLLPLIKLLNVFI